MREEASKPTGAVRSRGPSGPALLFVPQRNLTELVVAVTDENIVGLFAALLAERRVLLTASKLSTVRQTGPARLGRAKAWLCPWGRDDGADSYFKLIRRHLWAKSWICPFEGQCQVEPWL